MRRNTTQLRGKSINIQCVCVAKRRPSFLRAFDAKCAIQEHGDAANEVRPYRLFSKGKPARKHDQSNDITLKILWTHALSPQKMHQNAPKRESFLESEENPNIETMPQTQFL